MFLRESEGVYEFGSRRICIKVEKDKILIKVGGGHLSIDEFLDLVVLDAIFAPDAWMLPPA